MVKALAYLCVCACATATTTYSTCSDGFYGNNHIKTDGTGGAVSSAELLNLCCAWFLIFCFMACGKTKKATCKRNRSKKKYEYVQKWSRRGKVTKFLGYMLQQSLGVYNMYIQYNVSKCVYVCVAVWILAHSAATFSHTYTTAPLWDSNCCGHHIRCMCVSGDRRWGRRQNGCCLCVSLCSGSF